MKTFLLSSLALFFASPANALELRYPDVPGFGRLNDIADGAGLAQIVNFLFYGALWLAGLLAFAALLYAGFMLALSAGNPSHKVEAKQRLSGILLGMLMLLGAYVTLRTINPELVFLKNGDFTICDDKAGGFIPCPTLSVADLPKSSSSPFPTSSSSTALGMFHACLFDKTLTTPDGTLAIPPELDPNDTRISGCNDKIEKNASYLGDVSSTKGGDWDNNVYAAILAGLGRFTFYADPLYSGAWIEITLKAGGVWVCNFQHDGASAYQDCLDKILQNNKNKENHDKGVPVIFVSFTQFQKGTFPTDTFGGTAPVLDDGDISSIELEPRSFVGSCQVPNSGACSTGALSAFGEHAGEAAQICQAESGGRVDSLNDGCLRGQYDYSVGLFQINLYRTCRCPGAWVDASLPNWCQTEIALSATTCPTPFDKDVLDQCAENYGLGSASVNIQKALTISSGGANWCPWSTGLVCGLC